MSEKTHKTSIGERMLEMLLREKSPRLLEEALAAGKTIKGAWNYIVSVMKQDYIKKHGNKTGGMYADDDVVASIAEEYMKNLPEGATLKEAAPTGKSPSAKGKKKVCKDEDSSSDGEEEPSCEEVVEAVKAAAADAKAEREQSKTKESKKCEDAQQTLNLF